MKRSLETASRSSSNNNGSVGVGQVASAAAAASVASAAVASEASRFASLTALFGSSFRLPLQSHQSNRMDMNIDSSGGSGSSIGGGGGGDIDDDDISSGSGQLRGATLQLATIDARLPFMTNAEIHELGNQILPDAIRSLYTQPHSFPVASMTISPLRVITDDADMVSGLIRLAANVALDPRVSADDIALAISGLLAAIDPSVTYQQQQQQQQQQQTVGLSAVTMVRVAALRAIVTIAQCKSVFVSADSAVWTQPRRAFLHQIILSGLLDVSPTIRATCLEALPLLILPNEHLAQLQQQLSTMADGNSNSESNSRFNISALEVQQLVIRYLGDRDSRVRKAATGLMDALNLRGVCAHSVELYPAFVAALDDGHEHIRMNAMHLVWQTSRLYPNAVIGHTSRQSIPINSTRTPSTGPALVDDIRLVDDAMVKICDMANDVSMRIRARAVALIGGFEAVNTRFLLQTLDKKLMSHLKMRPTGWRQQPRAQLHLQHLPQYQKQQQQQQQHQQQPPSPQPNANSATPAHQDGADYDVQSDEFRLLDTGACGAFVHGLEDEYHEVRNSTIDSIGRLALGSREFAFQTLDPLIDMFNDDIDHVRLNAVLTLARIGSRSATIFEVSYQQLEQILGGWEDSSVHVRRGLYDLLGYIFMNKLDGLTHLISTILGATARFPEDRLHIYYCMAQVGRVHRDKVDVPQVEKWLGIDKPYLPQEKSPEEPTYIAYIAFILNGAAVQGKRKAVVMASIPKYVFRHLPYLRDKCLPGTFPTDEELSIPLEHRTASEMAPIPAVTQITRTSTYSHSPGQFLRQPHHRPDLTPSRYQLYSRTSPVALIDSIFGNISIVSRLMRGDDDGCARQTIAMCREQLRTVGHLSPSTGSASIYAGVCKYGELALDMMELMFASKRAVQESMLGSSTLREYGANLMAMAYGVESTIMGLPRSTKCVLRMIRVFAHVLWTLGQSTGAGFGVAMNGLHTGQMDVYALSLLRERLASALNFANATGVYAADIERIMMALGFTSSASAASQPSVASLAAFISQFTVAFTRPPVSCKLISATITQPVSTREKPIVFNAILPVSVNVSASIDGLSLSDLAVQSSGSSCGVVIQANMPDEHIFQFVPCISADFQWAGSMKLQLSTTIELPADFSTSQCCAELSIRRVITLDMADIDQEILNTGNGQPRLQPRMNGTIRPVSLMNRAQALVPSVSINSAGEPYRLYLHPSRM